MKDNNRILIVIVFVILLIIVASNFYKISGNVVEDIGGVDVSIEPTTISFNRFDSSHVVSVMVESGDFPLESYYVLRSQNGELVDYGELCSGNTCQGSISDNFIVESNVDSGSYNFVFNAADCDGGGCETVSPILEIEHI